MTCVRLRLLGVATLSCFSACAGLSGARALSAARPGSTTYHALTVDGRQRTFLLHLPPAAARGVVPLVLLFHGHRGSGAVAMKASGMNDVADRLGMAVVYPDGTGHIPGFWLSWNATTCCGYAVSHGVNDISFALTLIDTLAAHQLVKRDRVFAAGFSAGGMLSLRLACEAADRFVAVANVAGAMPDTACAPARPVPVLLVRGGADDDLRVDHAKHANRRPEPFPFSTSYEQAFQFWSRVNHCGGSELLSSFGGGASDVVLERATGCTSGNATELVTIDAHPHAWPGGIASSPFGPRPSDRVHGSSLVLQFFARQLSVSP